MRTRARRPPVRGRSPLPVMAVLVLCSPIIVTGCASHPRAPAWTCMQRTVDSLDLAPLPEARKHCVAAGSIALRCGRLSAVAAGYGKELADVFGPGRAERADLAANAQGRDCARRDADASALADCCAAAGY